MLGVSNSIVEEGGRGSCGCVTNLEMNAVTEESDRITARMVDSSTLNEISSKLLDIRATKEG